MLSISCESEGYDKGNIVTKDVAVTMGMFCALRLSLKPLIHTRSYVSLRSKRFCEERGKRVKDRAKNGSRLISSAIKTENPLPRSLFAPKSNANACYAG